MASVVREKKIKSADRVLEIFEMFSEERQFVTVMDVARTLDVPQSSTSEILGSLVRSGYLYRDRSARTFRPTARVALLGAWVQPNLFRHGRLLPMMDNLREATGEAIVLASMVGVRIKHVHVVGHDLPTSVGSGTEHHMLHSPFGIGIMSVMYRDNVRKLVHRLNAESEPEMLMRYADLEPRLERASKQGYVAGELGDGMSAVTVLLPQRLGEDQLALGIMGTSEAISSRCEQLVQELRGSIAHHFSPRSRPELRQPERAPIAAVN
jgi:DNA-binding IclR family transcriptional regulator